MCNSTNLLKITELYTSKGQILQYINYTSIKLFFIFFLSRTGVPQRYFRLDSRPPQLSRHRNKASHNPFLLVESCLQFVKHATSAKYNKATRNEMRCACTYLFTEARWENYIIIWVFLTKERKQPRGKEKYSDSFNRQEN